MSCKTLFILALAIAHVMAPRLCQAQPDKSDQPTIHLFLLAGQSNMAGADAELPEPPGLLQTEADRANRFTSTQLPDGERSELYVPWGDVHGHRSKGKLVHGPEVGFGRALYAAGWRDIAMIKVYGNFRREVTNWPWSEGQPFFQAWTSFVDARIAELRQSGHQVKVCGFLWHQGIDDAIHRSLALTYQQNLSDLIHALRKRYAEPQTPFVLARSVFSPIAQPTLDPNNESPMAQVRKAQVAVAESVPAVAWIDSDDLPKVNRHHFSAASQLVLGQRFGEAFLSLHRPVITSSDTCDSSLPHRVRGGRESYERVGRNSNSLEPSPLVYLATLPVGE